MIFEPSGGPVGSELLCRVRSGGKGASGKALLETNEIIFRGEMRLKIPLVSLRSVVARNGELHLKWSEGAAVFEIGDRAEKWAHKILHPKSTTEKLGIKPGLVVSALGIADVNFMEDLRKAAGSFSHTKAQNDSDLIFVGVEKAGDLARAGKLPSSLTSAGALWIVYPKGKKHITQLQVIDAGRQAGLVDVKVVSFSTTHTALKFVRPKGKR
jgi:hypothetical protein